MASESNTPQGVYRWPNTLEGIYYGQGSTDTALPKLLETIGGTKALIVTGKSLRNKTNVVQQVETILRAHNAYGDTFHEIGEHAPIAGIRNGAFIVASREGFFTYHRVTEGLNALKSSGANILVSVGGGSPIDAAKAIIYYNQKEFGGPFLKQIAIPTTLSAAEYTGAAGFTDESGAKVGVGATELVPSGVILDARLTLATPERLWLSTAIRALDHAVENLYQPIVPLPVKALCYIAIMDLFQYLPKCKADPNDLFVRQKLQIAAWESLWPIEAKKYRPGPSHALGHRLGATYGIPHGITSCITLAPIVHVQAMTASQEDKEALARILVFLRVPSTGSLERDVHKVADLIDGLVLELGLQCDPAQYRVPFEDAGKIVEQAVGASNPKYSSILEVFQSLWPSRL